MSSIGDRLAEKSSFETDSLGGLALHYAILSGIWALMFSPVYIAILVSTSMSFDLSHVLYLSGMGFMMTSYGVLVAWSLYISKKIITAPSRLLSSIKSSL